MQDASSTWCGKLLHTDMRQKIDLLKRAGWALTSHQWPYNALLWPCPLPCGKRSVNHGSRREKEGWHLPSTRLCNIRSMAMLRRSLGGAKLYSRNACSGMLSIVCKKRFWASSNDSNNELAASKIPPASFPANYKHVTSFINKEKGKSNIFDEN